MNHSNSDERAERVYRVDRFRVPAAGRAEFLAKIEETHAVLRPLDGFLDDHVVECLDGSGTVRVVTVVIWRNATVMAAAKDTVEARRRVDGFDPRELMSRLEIEADMGIYRPVGH